MMADHPRTWNQVLALAALCACPAALAAAPGAAGAAPRAAAPAPAAAPASGEYLKLDVQTLLKRFEEAQESTKSLEAKFVQIKASELLGEPQRSEGSLSYVKPDRFLWAYERPNDTRMVINGDTMITWYRDLKKANRVDIARKRHRIYQYLAVGEGAKALQERFVVEILPPAAADPAGTIHIQLIPLKKRVRTRLEKMEMWLDGKLYLPVRIRYEEGGGDSTDYTFTELKPNVAIPDSRFSLELPAGVAVSDVFSQPEPGEKDAD